MNSTMTEIKFLHAIEVVSLTQNVIIIRYFMSQEEKKPVQQIYKMIKDSRHTATKMHEITEEDSKRGRKKEMAYKIENNNMTIQNRNLSIINLIING